jgi:hypothetical protein
MTDDMGFDPVDAELRRRFDAAHPSQSDADTVLQTMRPRLRRAQQRHRAALTGITAAVVVVIVAVGFTLSTTAERSVRTPPATHATLRPEPAPSPTTTAPPTLSTDGRSGSGTGGSGSSAGATPSPGVTVAPPLPASGETPPTAPAPVTTPSEQQTYSSAGGSITVLLTNGVVSLVSSSPSAGYSQDIRDNGPTRVEVRFDNGPTESRIRVDIVKGQLAPTIS